MKTSEKKIRVRIPRENWRRWPNSDGYWLAFRHPEGLVWCMWLTDLDFRGGRLRITEDDEARKGDQDFWFVKLDLQFPKAKKPRSR